MIKLLPSGDFDEMYRQLVKNNQKLHLLVMEKISLFRKNPRDTRLLDHSLKRG